MSLKHFGNPGRRLCQLVEKVVIDMVFSSYFSFCRVGRILSSASHDDNWGRASQSPNGADRNNNNNRNRGRSGGGTEAGWSVRITDGDYVTVQDKRMSQLFGTRTDQFVSWLVGSTASSNFRYCILYSSSLLLWSLWTIHIKTDPS